MASEPTSHTLTIGEWRAELRTGRLISAGESRAVEPKVMDLLFLLASRPGEVKVVMEVGALTETVEVKAATELVQTQSSTLTSTITTEQINNLPLVSRNALYFTVFLPGVETLGGPRGSTIMGLPQNTINITIDGISNSNTATALVQVEAVNNSAPVIE